MVLRLRGGTTISVKTLTGKTISVELEAGETVSSLKAKISKSEGIDSEQQCLLLGQVQLENNKTLEEYSVTTQQLSLVLTLRGGPGPISSPKKLRCNAVGCNDKIVKIVGQCR